MTEHVTALATQRLALRGEVGRRSQAASWRFVFADLLTDRTIDVLPMTGVTFDRLIGRAGSLGGVIPVPNAAMGRRLEPLRAGRTCVYAYRDADIWWGGICWGLIPKGDERGRAALEVSAATFDSYAYRRDIRETFRFDQVDQFVLERSLWAHMQSTPAGNIGVQLGGALSGVLRDRTILATDGKKYGEAIAELQDNLDGWESTIDVYVDPATGKRVKALRQGYPTLGRTGGAPAVYSRPGDLLTYALPDDATRAGTSFQARGETPESEASDVTEEAVPLMSSVWNADDLLATGWPQLDVLLDHSTVKDVATLDAHAQAARAAMRPPFTVPQVTVRPGSFQPGEIGNMARFRITDALYPRRGGRGVGRQVDARVVGLKVSVPERGQAEKHTLILDEQE